MASVSSGAKRRVRHVVDRVAAPYIASIVAQVRNEPDPKPDFDAQGASEISPAAVPTPSFHNALHELRTLELERVPKGARRVLSVGANGRWYFDWFCAAYGEVDEHIGIEAFEEKPADLPPYVTWIPDTADRMTNVADSTIELVFAGQTSEHLWAKELAGFLEEAHRVLAEDGLLVLDSPNRLVTEHLLWSHGGHTIELSAGEMGKLLDLAGFEVISVAGLWNCVHGDRILQLEEGIGDSSVFVRRAVSGQSRPDDCFVWWINARRRNTPPDGTALRGEVDRLFEAHWDTRVCRGLYEPATARTLNMEPGASGKLGECFPFPLHEGTWTIAVTLERGDWSDVDDFHLRVVSPGDFVVHDLALEDAEISQKTARWTFDRPHLAFALAIQVWVGHVKAPLVLAMPFTVDAHDAD